MATSNEKPANRQRIQTAKNLATLQSAGLVQARRAQLTSPAAPPQAPAPAAPAPAAPPQAPAAPPAAPPQAPAAAAKRPPPEENRTLPSFDVSNDEEEEQKPPPTQQRVDVNAVNIFLSRSLRVAKSLDRQLDQLKEQRDEYEKKKTNLRIKVASIISAFTKNLFEQRVQDDDKKKDIVNKINGMITFLQKEASLNKEDQLSTDDLTSVADNMTNPVKPTGNDGSNTSKVTAVTGNNTNLDVSPSSSGLVCKFNKNNLLNNISASCYLDSVLFALFARKVPYLEENIVNVEAGDIKSDIKNCTTNVAPVLTELKKIITRLRSDTNTDTSDFYCTDLRKQMDGCAELKEFAKLEMQSSSEFLTKLLQFLGVYGEISKTETTYSSNSEPKKEKKGDPKISESNGRMIRFDENGSSLPFQQQYDSSENGREYTFNRYTDHPTKRNDVTLKTSLSYPLSAFVFFVVERQKHTEIEEGNTSINPDYTKLSSNPPESLSVTYNPRMKTFVDQVRETNSNDNKPAVINKERDDDKSVDLELYAVVVHNGIHYTCYLKCPNGTWIHYDDVGQQIEPIGKYDNLLLLNDEKYPNILTNGTIFFYKLPDTFLPENKAATAPVPAPAPPLAAATAPVTPPSPPPSPPADGTATAAPAPAAATAPSPPADGTATAATLRGEIQSAGSITKLYNEKRKGNFPNVYGLVYVKDNPVLDYEKIIELVDKNKEKLPNKINISKTSTSEDEKNNYATLLYREALIIYNEKLNDYRNNDYDAGGGNAILRPYRIDSCSVTGTRKDTLSTLGVLVASSDNMLSSVDSADISNDNILEYEISNKYTVKDMIDNTFDNIMLGLILNPHLKYVIYSSDNYGLIGIVLFKDAFKTKDDKKATLYKKQVQTYVAYKFYLLTGNDPKKWGYISNNEIDTTHNNETKITVDGNEIDLSKIFGNKIKSIENMTSYGNTTPIKTFQTDRKTKNIVLQQIC